MLAEGAFPAGAGARTGPSQGVSSGVFTPGHGSVLAAAKAYFGGYAYHPAQPIAFPHKVHLAKGLTCQLCHTGVATGPDASIPNVKFCMACHQTIDKDKPIIQKVASYYRRGEDIPWVRVYEYSPVSHLKFNHGPHIRAKVECSVCHGDMTKQTTAVRAVNLTMGRCIDCHRQRHVSVSCETCHY